MISSKDLKNTRWVKTLDARENLLHDLNYEALGRADHPVVVEISAVGSQPGRRDRLKRRLRAPSGAGRLSVSLVGGGNVSVYICQKSSTLLLNTNWIKIFLKPTNQTVLNFCLKLPSGSCGFWETVRSCVRSAMTGPNRSALFQVVLSFFPSMTRQKGF